MITKAPHFLLFSEAITTTKTTQSTSDSPSAQGRADQQGECWHFVIRTPDGATQLDVADQEAGASAERLELLAVVRGLEALDQPSKVTLVTPSGTVRRGLRFGLDYWRANRWRWERYGAMAPIKNADLWRRIDRALEFHDVECRTVRRLQPVDDLARPIPKSLTQPADRHMQRRVSVRPHKVSRHHNPPPQTTWSSRLLRCLSGWCGLWRSHPPLVIAGH